MFEEEPPKKKAVHTLGEDLARLSVADLEERIGLLKAEIARLEESIGAKRASQTVAATFFKK